MEKCKKFFDGCGLHEPKMLSDALVAEMKKRLPNLYGRIWTDRSTNRYGHPCDSTFIEIPDAPDLHGNVIAAARPGDKNGHELRKGDLVSAIFDIDGKRHFGVYKESKGEEIWAQWESSPGVWNSWEGYVFKGKVQFETRLPCGFTAKDC